MTNNDEDFEPQPDPNEPTDPNEPLNLNDAVAAVDALWDEPDPDSEDARDGLIWMTEDEVAMAGALRGLRAARLALMESTTEHRIALDCWCQPTAERQPDGSYVVIHKMAVS